MEPWKKRLARMTERTVMKAIICVRTEGGGDFKFVYNREKIIGLIESNQELIVDYAKGSKHFESCLLSSIVGDTVMIDNKEYTIKENAGRPGCKAE